MSLPYRLSLMCFHVCAQQCIDPRLVAITRCNTPNIPFDKVSAHLSPRKAVN